jgi:hypothetical protein
MGANGYRLPGNHWHIARHGTLHKYIFASILTLYIVISTLQCLPMETMFDPHSNLHVSTVIERHEGYSSIG